MSTIYDFLHRNEINPTTGRIGILMLTTYASLNSMLTLFFVTAYRRYTVEKLRILMRFFRKSFCGAVTVRGGSWASGPEAYSCASFFHNEPRTFVKFPIESNGTSKKLTGHLESLSSL